MNVLLTVPMNRSEKNIPSAEDYPYVNDNGLGRIAAVCNKMNISVTLLSWNVNLKNSQMVNVLKDKNPQLVGIKVFTTHFKKAFDTIKLIRETLPNTSIIIGGPHPSTSDPKYLFDEFNEMIDYAIAGDGELCIEKLLLLFQSKGKNDFTYSDFSKIPGLIYKTKNGINKNENDFSKCFDDLPDIDWSIQKPENFRDLLLKDDKTYKVYYEDSRGCQANCGHCKCSTINGDIIRKKRVDKILDEIEILVKKYNVREVTFTGNCFLSDVDYTKYLCELILKKNLGLNWICTGGVYVRSLKSLDLLKTMRKAGCQQIIFGIESGNSQIRNENQFPIPLKEYKEIITNTVTTGINAVGYFMFGFSGETYQQIKNTVKYSIDTPFTKISFCIYLPLPGTKSYFDVLNKYNIKRIDWYNYNFSNPELLPSKVSLSEIRKTLVVCKILQRSSLARVALNRIL